MVTQSNVKKVKDLKGLATISALTHPQIRDLVERKIINVELFEEKNITEVVDPDDRTRRYCLCKNLATGKRETETRKSILNRVCKKLEMIANSKKKMTDNEISFRVGKIIANSKVGKFINWEIQNKKLLWSLKTDLIDKEASLDGCYVIVSNVSKDKLNCQRLVASYKKLALVEKAFRNLKTVQLEIRPVYHKTDDRIRSHVFLCVLAYYLQWHMTQQLHTLFESDGKKENRFWTFENVIERLKSIRQEEVQVAGTVCKVITQLDEDQKKIFNLLGIKL